MWGRKVTEKHLAAFLDLYSAGGWKEYLRLAAAPCCTLRHIERDTMAALSCSGGSSWGLRVPLKDTSSSGCLRGRQQNTLSSPSSLPELKKSADDRGFRRMSSIVLLRGSFMRSSLRKPPDEQQPPRFIALSSRLHS